MKGEFSRLTFDARRHFAGVLQQQGRIASDADWNELVELFIHRLRAQTIDTIGACGSPKHDAGFGVSVAGSDVTLSPGRLYSGGLLAELEEDTDFAAQPDWPIPSQAQWNVIDTVIPSAGTWPGLDFSQLGAGQQRSDLFYAEVWLRSLTALNDEAERAQAAADGASDWSLPPLVASYVRERAFGGPDTCTRLQTLAQVKRWTLPDAAQDCPTACAALAEALPPATAGTLLVSVQATDPPIDPCTEPLAGGYGGAENRMYRVEIHDAGAAGVATFKWSSENGAFTIAVNAPKYSVIAANAQIVVQSIGNDSTVALADGQYVELCGLDTELGMWRNPIAKIVGQPQQNTDGTYSVVLDTQVVVPRAPFLRRWSSSAIQVPAALNTPFLLGDDSAISLAFFDQNGATSGNTFFHPADYWTWDARTITREIEPDDITQEPQEPQGIERHYCCLAIVTWTGDGRGGATAPTPASCTQIFPPLTEITAGSSCCCCTVTVGDGATNTGDQTDIRAAVAMLPAGGGVVCIEPGTYRIDRPIALGPNVEIRGCGERSVINAPEGAFRVAGSNVTISDLTFTMENAPVVAGGLPDVPAISNVTIRGNRVTRELREGVGYAFTVGAAGLSINDNVLKGCSIQVGLGSSLVSVRRNSLTSGVGGGIGLGASSTDASKGRGTIQSVVIEDNTVTGMTGEGICSLFDSGAESYALVQSAVIRRNQIRGCELQSAGAAGKDPVATAAIYIPLAESIEISENQLEDNGSATAGSGVLMLLCLGGNIHHNSILHNGTGVTPATAFPRAGIAVPFAFATPDTLGGDTTSAEAPAMAIVGNVIINDGAPALELVGAGQFIIDDNSFTSSGLDAENAPVGALVEIINFGLGEYGGTLYNLLQGQGASAFDNAGPTPDQIVVGGQIRFAGNCCLLDTRTDGVQLNSAIFIFTFDDCSIEGNQCRAFVTKALPTADQGSVIMQGFFIAGSLRVEGNRFYEDMADLSWLGLGEAVIAVGNTASHCFVDRGFQAMQESANIVNPLNATYCPLLTQLFGGR